MVRLFAVVWLLGYSTASCFSVSIGYLRWLHNPSSGHSSRTHFTTALSMGLFDSISNFLSSRQGDFVKLDDSLQAFGPGPLLLLYKAPEQILDDEIHDMLADEAPRAFAKGITLSRLNDKNGLLLQETMEVALNQLILKGKNKPKKDIRITVTPDMTIAPLSKWQGCPVLLFSGFDNKEMMQVYNVLGRELYQATGGATAACAKAVPNAMTKPLSQVLEEISSDHSDAMSMDRQHDETTE
jgi:hypothetical protein